MRNVDSSQRASVLVNFKGYWQLNSLRPLGAAIWSQATALLHSVNALVLRFR